MIRIIAEGLHDTAHSVFEAHHITEWKPDAVMMELPVTPFQKILTQYSQGKLNKKQLKKQLFAAIKKEEKAVDHELVKKFLAGEIELEELEVIEAEGREIHVMQVAKEVGAELHAMDLPLDKVTKIIEAEFKAEHITAAKQVIDTKRLPYFIWEISDIVHYPFYIMERVLQHHAIHTMNPYIHNVNECKICKAGIVWDRIAGSLLIGFLDKMPLSKEMKTDIKAAYIIRKVDELREQYMASRIAGVYNNLKKKLGREPKILAIVHLWSAKQLERMLEGIE